MQIIYKIKKQCTWLLFPFAILYWGIIFLRNLFYDLNLFTIHKAPCKIISVGNISTGGTGKTPTVIYLCSLLKNHGKKVAVLSRGHGRATKGLLLVSKGNGPLCKWGDCGDEPFMLSENLFDVPILVDENRYRGSLYLLKHFTPEIIIMDDGFQHRSLNRDVDIVLVDGGMHINDHKLLPQGLLREPWHHIKRADVIIITKKQPEPLLQRRLMETHIPTLKTRIIPSIVYHKQNLNLEISQNEKCYIVTGIGNSQFFKTTVKRLGYDLIGYEIFPDHFNYSKTDLINIENNAKKAGATYILTTQKDWVKLRELSPNFSFGIIDIRIRASNENLFLKLINT